MLHLIMRAYAISTGISIEYICISFVDIIIAVR